MGCRRSLCIVALLTLGGAGCEVFQSKGPTPKEEATQNWNTERANMLMSLAQDQLHDGSLDGCRQTISKALTMSPESEPLHVLSARLAIEQGELELADRELQTAHRLNDRDADAWYLGGVVYQRWQKPQVALEQYRHAFELRPTELAPLLAEAEMLVAMGRHSEALALLESHMDGFDHSGSLRDAIGQLLMEEQKYSEAAAVLRQGAELAADDLTIQEHLALAQYRAGQFAACTETVGRLLKDDQYQDRGDLWTCLGQSQLGLGSAAEACASFQRATEENPRLPGAWVGLSRATMELGETRQAESAIEKLIGLEPDNAEAHLMLGCVRLRQKRVNDALVEFRRAHMLDGTDPLSLCMIGRVLEKRGRWDEATAYYAQALKLKPHDDIAARLLAGLPPEAP